MSPVPGEGPNPGNVAVRFMTDDRETLLPAMSPHLSLLLLLALLVLPAGAATVITSPDGLVTLESPDPITAELEFAFPVTPPEEWVPIDEAYLLTPPDLVIASPATITFVVPPSLAGEPGIVMVLAHLGDEGWEMLPSRVQEKASGQVITAPVSKPGVYSLMTQASSMPDEEVAAPPTTEAPLPVILPFVAALFASLMVIGRKR